RVLIAGLLAVLSTPLARAADSLWSGGGPEGASVTVLATDPQHPITVYAGTLDGGIWKTTDGASHWKPAYSGLPTIDGHFASIDALAVDPTVASRVYAATQIGFFASENGGAAWSESGAGALLGF